MLTDNYLSITEKVQKTMKWYRKLLFHPIDLCLSSAHELYKIRNKGPTPFPSLHFTLPAGLVDISTSSQVGTLPEISSDFMYKFCIL